MTCNCGNGDTPEYYITLDGVGVDGYSPEVNVIDETSSSFKLEAVNKNNTQQTPAIPKLAYLESTYATNTDLAGKLNKDGSNAEQNIVINQAKIISLSNNSGVRITNNNGRGVLQLSPNATYLQTGSYGLVANYDSGLVSLGNVNGTAKVIQATADKVYYEAYSFNPSDPDNEIATIGDIPSVPTVGNGTITITQDGVTKGSFTTNQSGNTTIDLDGVTNPLDIKNSDNTRSISLGINSDNQAYMYYNICAEGGGFSVPVGLLYLSSDTIDFTKRSADGLYTIEVKEMVGCDSITGGASGLVPAPSAGDQDKFLKGDGTWDTVGGGGSSYTAGTGINITNDTISVKDVQNFTRITIANGYSAGMGLWGKLLDGSSSIPLVRVSGLDDVIIGDDGSKLVLHGDETRPSYFDSHTTSYLALYSDIPDVSNFVTTSTLSTTLADYVLSSSLATVATTGSYADLLNKPTIPTNSDYVDLSSNQTVGGNKTFTGTNYLRNTYICNASGTYFGRMRAVDSKFTFEGIGTNRSINFIPDGTGELQYNGTEVATVNDIPDVSQLQEKLTAGDGIKLSKGINIPLEQTLPYTFNSSYANTKFVNASNFDQTKERVVIIEVPISNSYTQFYMSNESRRGFLIDTSDLTNIYVADGSSYGTSNQTSFPVSGSHNYLKFVIDTNNTFDVYYGYDNLTWTLLLSKDRSNQNTDTWEYGVNVYNESTTGWTLDYLEAFYPLANSELISCDDTIQRKLNATGGIKIEPNGSIKVNPLIALPYTASESSTDKIFNASDTSYDGAVIYGKWDARSVIVFSGDSTALRFGYGFYWSNDSLVAMARYDYQYATLETISNIPYQSDFYYKIQFFQDGTVDMYYSIDGITYNLAISTTTAVGGDLYGQDIYVCGGNGSTLSGAYLSIPSTNPVISLDPTTIQGYSSTGTLYLKLVDGVLQWTA